jgi:glucose-6-phosphate dehydrogenase assembly protein OpcA
VYGRDTDPCSRLLAGWLSSRLGVNFPVTDGRGTGMEGVAVELSGGNSLRLHRAGGSSIVLERGGTPDTAAAQQERDLGDLLAEELRHLDADQPYAEALGAAFGVPGLSERRGARSHIWRDPMEPAEPVAPEPR